MKKYIHPVYVLLAGVITAQVLFSILVYSSNISLYHNLMGIKDSGYLIVPNELVISSLLNFTSAVCGGLFFSLTTGAGLSLITCLLVIVWRLYSRNYWVLAGLFLTGVTFLFLKFHFNFPLTLVCAFIIGTVMYAALKLFPENDNNSGLLIPLISAHLAVILLIVLIWMPVINKNVFISIRDNLLLSNPVGQKINDFYYKYTLYPAESFKSLDQKLLKSCHITIDDPILNQRIQQRLTKEDYLPVNDKFKSDLSVEYRNDKLIFKRQDKTIHQCALDEFLKGSEKILELISDQSDQKQFLRKITFLSLISASPLLCYIIVHTFFMIILFFIKSKIFRITGASIACLTLFTLPAVSYYLHPPSDMNHKDISENLKSDFWQQRVSALKAISELNLTLQYLTKNQLERFISSPLIAERYWVAKALGSNRSTKSYQLILELLDDPQPNVVCMAMYSLGKQHQTDAENEILSRINNYDHWYVQWYAYKALKRLGWTQKR